MILASLSLIQLATQLQLTHRGVRTLARSSWRQVGRRNCEPSYGKSLWPSPRSHPFFYLLDPPRLLPNVYPLHLQSKLSLRLLLRGVQRSCDRRVCPNGQQHKHDCNQRRRNRLSREPHYTFLLGTSGWVDKREDRDRDAQLHKCSFFHSYSQVHYRDRQEILHRA